MPKDELPVQPTTSPSQHGSDTTSGSAMISVTMEHSMSFEGSLPPPSLIQEYEKIIPGAADRIFRMAEYEGNHRRRLEFLGMIFAFVVVMVLLLVGAWLIYTGKDVQGFITLTAAVVPSASLFVMYKVQDTKGAKRN